MTPPNKAQGTGGEVCRRCSECRGAQHHWLHGEGGFDERTGRPLFDYGCKHCPALANTCNACDEGVMNDGDRCEQCGGTGVIEDDIFERCESCGAAHFAGDTETWPRDEDDMPLCPTCAAELMAEEQAHP